MKLLNWFANRDTRGQYTHHQGERERARRIRQVMSGKLEMAGVSDVVNAVMRKAFHPKAA